MNFQDVQRKLKDCGFDPGLLDGQPGPKSLAAVIAFQASRGLKADGIIGTATLEALAQTGLAIPALRVGDNGIYLIKSFEGIKDGNPKTVELDPYICPAGIVTIGWGHVIYDAAGNSFDADELGVSLALAMARERMKVLWGMVSITKGAAEQLLATDINKFSGGILGYIDKGSTSQGEFDALTSFAFNVGLGNFAKSTLRRLHNSNAPAPQAVDPYDLLRTAKQALQPDTISEAFTAYCRVEKQFSLGVFRRRYAEALIYAGASAQPAVQKAFLVK